MDSVFKPTESELEILHALWEIKQGTVRQINDKLNEKRDVGYTTTLKIMQIMHEKGLVTRNEASKTHIYIPLLNEDTAKGNLVTNFIENTFKGSASQLVMHALGNHEASLEELEEIKALINKIENQ